MTLVAKLQALVAAPEQWGCAHVAHQSRRKPGVSPTCRAKASVRVGQIRTHCTPFWIDQSDSALHKGHVILPVSLMSKPPKLTDRTALLAHRARARVLGSDDLHKIATHEIEERLQDVNKTFTKPVLVGHAPACLQGAFPSAQVVDDEELLPLESAAHDLVIHAFGLHWASDPVGQLVQSRLALVPDGLFVGVMFGGQTLFELRSVLAEAEASLTSGISPRVVPFADVRALGDLLLRAGFALPVADTVRIELSFASIRDLARTLRRMGETNALDARLRTPTPAAFWARAEDIYRTHFPDKNSKDKIVATFELVFLTGWAPHESQQKPLSPGAAKTRLADALGVPEFDSGDVTKPPKR